MKIGLVDVDGHNFPNIPLMKLSTYHKHIGDKVEFARPMFGKYDILYKSKVFTFSPDNTECDLLSDKVIKGGTGYDARSTLPSDVETILDLDYSLYPQYNFSVQFFSRGCIRNCGFCLVREKEGYIHTVKPMNLNPNGKYIEVLDNNFFANPEWREAIEILKSYKQPVKLSGVDVRLINEEQAFALNSLKIKSGIHIAWDNPRHNIIPHVKEMIKYIKPYKIICYVLIGFNSSIEEDYHRVRELFDLGIVPHVQPYRDYENNRIPTQYEKDFARWANNKIIFKSCDFKDYKPRKGFNCRIYFK